jgi:hypothetical protein
MKYPEMKDLFLSALFVRVPAQADTTLFDNFSDGLSSDKYQAMEEKIELNTLNENLEFSAGMQSYLKHTRANHL